MRRFYAILVLYKRYELSNISQIGYISELEAINEILSKINEEDLIRIADNCYKDNKRDITYIVKEVTISKEV